MAIKLYDKISKYQDGNFAYPLKQGPGKPKKAVIFAEAPEKKEVSISPKNKKFNKGEYNKSLIDESFEDFKEYAHKNFNYDKNDEQSGRELDDIFSHIGEVLFFRGDTEKVVEILEQEFGDNILEDPEFKKIISKASGYTGIVNHGLDNFNIDVKTRKDDTFIEEAKLLKKLIKQKHGVDAEIVDFYGKDSFKDNTKKYNKDNLKDADVFLLGHSGHRIAGVDLSDWNSYLSENMDKDRSCYGGICYGGKTAYKFKDVPNFKGTTGKPWIGIPRYPDFNNKGTFDEIFFGNKMDKTKGVVVSSKGIYDEDYTNYSIPGTPKVISDDDYDDYDYGEDFYDNFFRGFSEEDMSEYRRRVGSNNYQDSTPPPTIRRMPIQPLNITRRLQNGGNPMVNYGSGIYGDAGNLFTNLLGSVNTSGMFDTKSIDPWGDKTSAAYRDKIAKERGLEYKHGNLWRKNKWIDPKTGEEFDKGDLDLMAGQMYNSDKANVDQFNKFLPVTQNMAALFDLQQKEQDEMANSKMRVQDFPTSMSSYAPVGIAQDGGGTSNDILEKYPALKSIQNLPKDMSKEHKDKVLNTAFNEMNQVVRKDFEDMLKSESYLQRLSNFWQDPLGKRDEYLEKLNNTKANFVNFDRDGVMGMAYKGFDGNPAFDIYPEGLLPNVFGHEVYHVFDNGKTAPQVKSYLQDKVRALSPEESKGRLGHIIKPEEIVSTIAEVRMGGEDLGIESFFNNTTTKEDLLKMEEALKKNKDTYSKSLLKSIQDLRGVLKDDDSFAEILNTVAYNGNQEDVAYMAKDGGIMSYNKKFNSLIYKDGGDPERPISSDEQKKIEAERQLTIDYVMSKEFSKKLSPYLSKGESIEDIRKDAVKTIREAGVQIGDVPGGAGVLQGNLMTVDPGYLNNLLDVTKHEFGHVYTKGLLPYQYKSIIKNTLPYSKTDSTSPFYSSEEGRDGYNDRSVEEVPALVYVNRDKIRGILGLPQGAEITPEHVEQYQKIISSDKEKYKFEKSQFDYLNFFLKPDEKSDSKTKRFSNILNTIAYNGENNDSQFMAKDGGKISKLQQMMGYKDNSPYKNLPQQTIYSDTITMDGVSKPLLAIANNGMTTLMKPNSGIYNFPGATQVTEIPMAQDGQYVWSRGGGNASAISNASASTYATTQSKETQKDINKRQEQINKEAKAVLSKKKVQELTEEDYNLIQQSTLPNTKNTLRDYRIHKANEAQKKDDSWTAEGFKNSTAAIGDKLSLQRLPIVGDYIPDVLDVTGGIGQMASGLGNIPQNLQKGEYGQAALNLVLPLATGALAGMGATTTGRFANNLINPFAGAGKLKYRENVPTIKNSITGKPATNIPKPITNIPKPANVNDISHGLPGDNYNLFEAWEIEGNKIDAFKDKILNTPGIPSYVDKKKLGSDLWDFLKKDNSVPVEKWAEDYINNITNKRKSTIKNYIDDRSVQRNLEVEGKSFLNDMMNRINTSEGLKRASNLGTNVEELNKINFSSNRIESFGGISPYYQDGTISVPYSKHNNIKSPRRIFRHEFEHGVQNYSGENYEDMLNTLDDLKVSNKGQDAAYYNKSYSKPNVSEKPAFLAELQEYLIDKKFIKHAYDNITPEIVEKAHKFYNKNPIISDDLINGNKLRILDILEKDKNNYNILSKALNKMLAIVPVVGAGAAELSQQNKNQNTQQYQQGGAPNSLMIQAKPMAQDGKFISHKDSISHQADKILLYEQLRGGPGGAPLSDYKDPAYKKLLMEDILPEIDKIMPNATAMEKAEAMDLVFNSGFDKNSKKITIDPRAYAIQEYYKKYDKSKLDKDGKWAGRKNPAYSFDEEYEKTVGKLNENDRRILMNRGRDWFYQNRAPKGSTWDLKTQGPHPNYKDTWYGRIWNTNDFKPFDPKNPKFSPPKKQDGGGFLGQLFDTMDVPQKKLMKYIMGAEEKPSYFINDNNVGSKMIGTDNYKLLADLLVDPLNFIPMSKVKYLRGMKGEVFTKPLSKTQKIERALHKVSNAEAVDEIFDSGAFKNNFLNRPSDLKSLKMQDGGGFLSKALSQVQPDLGDEEEMIFGVIDMLREVEDLGNRERIAYQKLEELLEEGVEIDEDAFMDAVMEDDEEEVYPGDFEEDTFELDEEIEEDELEIMREGGMPKRYKEMGFSKVDTPKRTPNHKTKSHAVVVKDGSKYKLIRFGQQGVSGSPKKSGESKADANRRKSFKARHAKNIAKGKTSAAFWANRSKW